MIKPRRILQLIEHKLLKTENVIIITGARQTGKTSIMRYLLDKYAPRFNDNVLYLDLEDELLLSDLRELKNSEYPTYLRNKGLRMEKSGLLFIDEIQYLERPTKVLKFLHDHYRQIRLVVSGSSSLELKKKVKESLTGRKSVFHLHTLSWREFLEFRGSPLAPRLADLTLNRIFKGAVSQADILGLAQELEALWEEFITYGGYPKVVLTPGLADKQDELREIYNSYVKKDIKDLAAVKEVGKFNKLARLLGWQIGNLVVTSELSNSTDLNIATCNDYLELLEQTFVLRFIQPFYSNKRLEIIKSSKIFFLDTGLRNAVTDNYRLLDQRADKGALLENYVFSELTKREVKMTVKYWRKKNSGLEVDFILENQDDQRLLPIEVKYQSYQLPRVPRGLASFLTQYPARQAVVINKNLFAKVRFQQTEVHFIPAWLSW